MAANPRVARFNADIERWLQAAHEIVPIAVAYRGQDEEAGGTKLSDWHAASVAKVPELEKRLGKPKKGSTLEHMVKGLLQEHADAGNTGPSTEDLIHELSDAATNIPRHKREVAEARSLLAELERRDEPETWWLLANKIADEWVATSRGDNLLGSKPVLEIAMSAFRHALVSTTPAALASGFKVVKKEGYPAWHLDRIVVVALESALRAGDAGSFRNFAKALNRTSKHARKELEESAESLDELGLGALAKKMRSLSS